MELVKKKNISYPDSKSHDGARKYFKDKYGRVHIVQGGYI